jgi:hypothetical protein
MTDYKKISLPEDKSEPEYTYVERRAAILQIIERKGHPWGLNKSELGRRFNVSDVQIHKDMDRIKEYYSDLIGKHAKETTEIAYRRILQEQLDEGDYEKARRTLDSWNSWLQDTGHQEQEPDQHEVAGNGIMVNLNE